MKKFSDLIHLKNETIADPAKPSSQGLIMIQIDGLSRAQFEKALKTGKMPFLSTLMRDNFHDLHSFYSGLPSSTPAVQGELFYGKRCSVPSFGFMDPTTGKLTSMFSPSTVFSVEKQLAQNHHSILTGGCAYCDIYNRGTAGGAFCSSQMGINGYLKLINPLQITLLLLRHSFIFLRIITLLILETIFATGDFLRGLIEKQNFCKEMLFIPARVGICVLLRELITANVSLNIRRGVRLIHCNFLGYDEQSHRRGPSSAFAHWTLKGIDDAIKRVVTKANASGANKYSIWIYSDHGQEHTVPYSKVNGMPVETAIAKILLEAGINVSPEKHITESVQLQRVMLLGLQFFCKFIDGESFKHSGTANHRLKVIAVGPVGHIYLPDNLSARKLNQIGLHLAQKANIPLVMRAEGNSAQVRVWNKFGEWILPQDIVKVAGSDHPFLRELSGDLFELVNHPFSGDFVFCGWVPGGSSVSFPIESGAHAGPGVNETHGFALLPKNSPVNLKHGYIRPRQLREAVQKFIKMHDSFDLQ